MITHPLGKNIGPPKSDKKYYQILILLFHFYKILGWLNAHIFKEKKIHLSFSFQDQKLQRKYQTCHTIWIQKRDKFGALLLFAHIYSI